MKRIGYGLVAVLLLCTLCLSAYAEGLLPSWDSSFSIVEMPNLSKAILKAPDRDETLRARLTRKHFLSCPTGLYGARPKPTIRIILP